MSVPSAALLAIVDRLGRKRDTLREYIEQADEQRMPEWVSRYTETHDAYQEAIDMIEECIANPCHHDGAAPAPSVDGVVQHPN